MKQNVVIVLFKKKLPKCLYVDKWNVLAVVGVYLLPLTFAVVWSQCPVTSSPHDTRHNVAVPPIGGICGNQQNDCSGSQDDVTPTVPFDRQMEWRLRQKAKRMDKSFKMLVRNSPQCQRLFDNMLHRLFSLCLPPFFYKSTQKYSRLTRHKIYCKLGNRYPMRKKLRKRTQYV